MDIVNIILNQSDEYKNLAKENAKLKDDKVVITRVMNDLAYKNERAKMRIYELEREIKRLKIELQIATRGSNRVGVVIL